MSEELRIYQEYSSFVKRFLLVSGLCPFKRERNIIYRCVSIWSIFSCFISLCTIGNLCLQNIRNINLFTKSFTLFVTILNVTVKASSFSIYQKKLQQVDDILDTLLEEALSSVIRIKSVVFFCVRAFYRLIYAQTILMTITVIIYLLKPMITKILHEVNNATNVQYLLPVSGTYPWTIDTMLVWQLHYLFDANVVWFIFSISTGIDAFFSFCMYRMSAILRLLAFNFNTRFSNDKENKECEVNYEQRFRQYVKKHVLLLKCRDVVQEAYGPVILLVTVTNAMGMCTLIFQMFRVTGMSIGRVVMSTVYLFMKLIQTFSYAWPGDVLLTESELLRSMVYFSDWYKYKNFSLAKRFCLILAQRPITLKACHLIEVSLDLFAKILNTTISYYFLLETLDNNK